MKPLILNPRVKLHFTPEERAELESRAGKHKSLSAFIRHAIGYYLNSAFAYDLVPPKYPHSSCRPFVLNLELGCAGRIRSEATRQKTTMSAVVLAICRKFPVTHGFVKPRTTPRNRRITTPAGRINLQSIQLGHLLMALQASLHATYGPIGSVEMTGHLARIAAWLEGGAIPPDSPPTNPGSTGGQPQ